MPSDNAAASKQSDQVDFKNIKVETTDSKNALPHSEYKPFYNNNGTNYNKTLSLKRPPDVKPESNDLSGECQQIAKKPKLGVLGIPNFRNIKKTNQPESARYPDYYLIEIKNSCESIIKTRVSKLITMPMYSYSANVLCKYTDKDKAKFVPLEITICAHSVKAGRIEQPYHVLIDPGDIPLRCYNISKDHAEATHKITIGNGNYPSVARNDYKNIYKEILSYTKAGERTILIGDVHDLDQVKGTIEWLYEKAVAENPASNLAKPSTWTVVPIVDYVVAMYNHVHMKMLGNDSPKFVLPYYLRMQLECSLLDYNPALMCSYHSKEEYQTKWCTSSCAQRMFHVIEPTLEGIQVEFEKATSRPRPSHSQPAIQNSPRPTQFFQPAGSGAKGIVYAPEHPQELAVAPNPVPLAVEAPPSSGVSSMDPRLRRSLNDTQ